MPTQPLTQFQSGQIWPDNNGVHINAHGGGLLLHDGTYYWFGEHKVAGEAGNKNFVGVHGYSSSDLLNWTDRGIALPASDDPDSPIAKGKVLERPKVIYRPATGKFVMWFHVEDKPDYTSAYAGVAVADSPVGPYEFLHVVHPDVGIWPDNAPAEDCYPLTETQRAELAAIPFFGGPTPVYPPDIIYRRDFERGQMSRDMTLFVDDDGTAYHVFASEDNGVLHISQLSDEGLIHIGRYIRVFPGRFHEAPALFKRGGRYYLISSDCTGWNPNPARSAVADSIWGPWTELGNPVIGTDEQVATTFGAQSTYVVEAPGHPGQFILLTDQWRPENAIDGRYVWLPIQWIDDKPRVRWHDAWDLRALDSSNTFM